MESLSGNHKTVNASKALNSGKLIGSIIEFAILFNFYLPYLRIDHFSEKCYHEGSCSNTKTSNAEGKSEEEINHCYGKLCRYKCRCENRFKLTEEEISVYRQITHYWDGGVDYYTGNELIKYREMENLKEKYKLLEKPNLKSGLVQGIKVVEATQANLKQYRQCQCKRCKQNSENNSLKSY